MKFLQRRQFLHLAMGAATLPAVPGIAKAQTVASAPHVVRVGYQPFAPPLSSLPNATPENYATLNPNSAQGAMIDLYKAIANDAGFQLQFLAFVSGELPGALVSHTIDTLYTVSSPANKASMDFSQPIFADSEVLIANKSDTTPYKTYADLKGQIVGSRTGSIYEDDMKKNGLAVMSYVTAPELYKAVNTGEVNVAINTRYIPTGHALLQGQYPNVQIVKSYQAKFSDVLGIATSKDHRSSLFEMIDTSLTKLKADGAVKTIFARYGIVDALLK
jgi:polar amino acid transport system substrate-binding protein